MRSVVRAVVLAAAGAATMSGAARRAGAQQSPSSAVMPELRADLLAGHHPAAQLGGGVQIPIGYYVRLGLIAAAGVRIDDASARPAGSRITDGRLDVLARFLLDPFRQTRYGVSLGGGMSLRAEPGERARPLLLVAMDLEGRRAGNGWVPAVQLGLGGGARLGIILRRGAEGSR
ncbi:MAG TPA: hypothetical protein VM033_08085 [Gemmatimonadaceae bacterium]|nr:hypothetical protein [Gemmatimonadaceae bacterium]